jgi:hypothetical protein
MAASADDETFTASQKQRVLYFHILFIILNLRLKVKRAASCNAHFTVETEQFQAAIAIDTLNLLTAAGDRKVVQLVCFNPKQILKNIWFNAAEAGAIGINATFAGGVIEVNTPPAIANHAQIER